MLNVDVIVTVGGSDAYLLKRCLKYLMLQRLPEDVRMRVIVGIEEGVELESDDVADKALDILYLKNTKSPKDLICGRITGRSNFLNCIRNVNSDLLMFCHHDDCWSDDMCVNKHVAAYRNSGKASAIRDARMMEPSGLHKTGREMSINDFCIPSKHLLDLISSAPVYKVPALDYYIITIESANNGVVLMEGVEAEMEDRHVSSWKNMPTWQRQYHMFLTVVYVLLCGMPLWQRIKLSTYACLLFVKLLRNKIIEVLHG